ncbi:conserved hypothetical protein [Candidatus Nitrosotenuis uzonensis]|uniref:Roadblock/LAMTOR2 domain-containing protein n=1 Tax=Candidatus Nitrosotenuis uzonensis TaxID=1407055 RepID=V6AV93_9ARCH|nr:conserved hypothetical protein [Candidatus Nitrosotenuis uzonensis]
MDVCKHVMSLDESMRFVGRIKDKKVIAFARHPAKKPLLDTELGNLAHYVASVKAEMEEMFDGPLGKTNWMITAKEKVKLITLFLDDGLLIFSIDVHGDHDQIIKKIQSLNMPL